MRNLLQAPVLRCFEILVTEVSSDVSLRMLKVVFSIAIMVSNLTTAERIFIVEVLRSLSPILHLEITFFGVARGVSHAITKHK